MDAPPTARQEARPENSPFQAMPAPEHPDFAVNDRVTHDRHGLGSSCGSPATAWRSVRSEHRERGPPAARSTRSRPTGLRAPGEASRRRDATPRLPRSPAPGVGAVPECEVEVRRRPTHQGDGLVRDPVDDSGPPLDQAEGPRGLGVGAGEGDGRRRRHRPPRGGRSVPAASLRGAMTSNTSATPSAACSVGQTGDGRRPRRSGRATAHRASARRRGGPSSRGTVGVARTAPSWCPGTAEKLHAGWSGGSSARVSSRTCRRTRHTSRAAAAPGRVAGRGPAGGPVRARAQPTGAPGPGGRRASVTVPARTGGHGSVASRLRTVCATRAGRTKAAASWRVRRASRRVGVVHGEAT